MAICIPISLVASLLAFFYGRSVHHAWLPAILTFVFTMAGGLIFAGIGQIVGVVLSALIIFIFFTLPEQRRIAQEQADRDREAAHLPNEEDI